MNSIGDQIYMFYARIMYCVEVYISTDIVVNVCLKESPEVDVGNGHKKRT